MSSKSYRTCQNCGTINLNEDYCQNCGEIVNINLKRRLEREHKGMNKLASDKAKKKNRISIFFENAQKSKNLAVRYSAQFFYSIWVIVLAVGSFLALLFSYIAA